MFRNLYYFLSRWLFSIGAIAILFLFIIMILNYLSDNRIYYLSFLLLLVFVLLLEVYLIFEKVFSTNPFWVPDCLSYILDNYYLTSFLLAGCILLVAMVGAIVLTLSFTSVRKNEMLVRQMSRSDKFLAFFKY